MTYYDQVAEAAAFLKARLGSLAPKVGIVLGSGLGAVADAVADPVIVPYAEIPHFPQSTVEGHSGRIVAALLGGAPVVIMQGRVHYYEGYTPLAGHVSHARAGRAGRARRGADQCGRRHSDGLPHRPARRCSPTTST